MNTDDRGNLPADPLSRRSRAAAWLRGKTTHALVVAVVAATIGGTAPLVITQLWDRWFEDEPAGCPGAGCDGKDPQREGCGVDAVTWHPPRHNPVDLHIRYSKRCAAVWGRITNGEKGDTVTVEVRDGGAASAIVQTNNDKFTPMVSVGSSFRATACAAPTDIVGRSGEWKKYCIEAGHRTPWSTDPAWSTGREERDRPAPHQEPN